MAEDPSAKLPSGLAEILSTLMANEALMSQIQGIVGESVATSAEKDGSEESKTATERPPSIDPKVMEKLPEVVAVLRPFLETSSSKDDQRKEETKGADPRTALLCALKPYLSPRRCEVIDYITRISRLGDVMKHLKL